VTETVCWDLGYIRKIIDRKGFSWDYKNYEKIFGLENRKKGSQL
jgi:hypothetical protein